MCLGVMRDVLQPNVDPFQHLRLVAISSPIRPTMKSRPTI